MHFETSNNRISIHRKPKLLIAQVQFQELIMSLNDNNNYLLFLARQRVYRMFRIGMLFISVKTEKKGKFEISHYCPIVET